MAELRSKKQQEQRGATTVDEWLSDPGFLDNLQKILPKHMNSDRFASVVMRQFRAVPGLRECSPQSVLSGFMDAAMLGLEIGINGEAYLIPYNNKVKVPNGDDYWEHQAQLQIGYLGHLKLAWNSGRVASIDADVVTHDEVSSGRFEFQKGDQGFLRHKLIEGRDVSEESVAYAWGMVWIKGSDKPIWRVLDAKQIDRLRHTGKSANFPAWTNHFDEMSMGKVLKRTLKWAPKSPEQAHSIALDDLADAGVVQTYNSGADIAGLLGEPAPKNEAQTMMDQQRAAGNGSPNTEAADSTNGTVGEGSSPPDPDKREKVPVPKSSGVGW